MPNDFQKPEADFVFRDACMSRYEMADKLTEAAHSVEDAGAKLRLLNMARSFRMDTYLTPNCASTLRCEKQKSFMTDIRHKQKQQRGL